MLSGFSDEERAQLNDYLSRIIANLTEDQADAKDDAKGG